MILTEQQHQAMKMIEKFIADKDSQVFILKGYAGTGKTTMIRYIVDYLTRLSLKVKLMASTGRAAKILRLKLQNEEVSTIHKGIYTFFDLVIEESEGELKYIYPLSEDKDRKIYIVDEASMISSNYSKNELFQFGTGILINDLLTYARLNFGGKIIFVGDPMQLAPVGDNHSAALDEKFFHQIGLKVDSYELTDIVRQDKHSCILNNAKTIRDLIKQTERNQLIFEKKENEVMNLGVMEVVQKYCENPAQTSSIVCYSNQQAADYNTAIRSIMYPNMNHVTAGDKLMVTCNNYYLNPIELLNGEIITVVNVSDNLISQSAPVRTEKNGKKITANITLKFREISFQTENGDICTQYIIDTLLQNKSGSLTIDEKKALYINTAIRIRTEKGIKDDKSREFRMAVMKDPFYNALQVKYGYAFTCHKSQGGEWDTVYVDFSKRTGLDEDSLRWKYTAITRASKMLWCINLPDVTPIDSLQINPINKAAKIAANALSLEQVKETPFHDLTALPSVKCKYWSVVQNMCGSQYSIKNITCKPWRDIYEINTPIGIVRVDAIYNSAGVFTKYETETNDTELLDFFQNEQNIRYKIDYHPSMESLKTLHNRMLSLCDEYGITLTNVIEGHYQLTYYMKASGNYAAITFFFDKKGCINYAVPLSDIGEADTKLLQLIDKLTK